MKSRLGERGQMVIPKPLRERLGLRGGQLLEVREDRGQLIVTKSLQEDPIEAVYGILQTGLTTDEMIEEMRGPAILPPETEA
ncbi:MAG: AbrB/MazE/SpoVT family DNA-binding domain-containing protein [Chloroflexota bacterium]|nr:AbrB/MazE/SpoVT family DNA-binding domain-containing protein [Chloroflexota bacterium]